MSCTRADLLLEVLLDAALKPPALMRLKAVDLDGLNAVKHLVQPRGQGRGSLARGKCGAADLLEQQGHGHDHQRQPNQGHQ